MGRGRRPPTQWRSPHLTARPPLRSPEPRRYQHEGVTEAEWRSGAKLRPYIYDALKVSERGAQREREGGRK
jgi:hypothetical protein